MIDGIDENDEAGVEGSYRSGKVQQSLTPFPSRPSWLVYS